jgi:hypothetical protein
MEMIRMASGWSAAWNAGAVLTAGNEGAITMLVVLSLSLLLLGAQAANVFIDRFWALGTGEVNAALATRTILGRLLPIIFLLALAVHLLSLYCLAMNGNSRLAAWVVYPLSTYGIVACLFGMASQAFYGRYKAALRPGSARWPMGGLMGRLEVLLLAASLLFLLPFTGTLRCLLGADCHNPLLWALHTASLLGIVLALGGVFSTGIARGFIRRVAQTDDPAPAGGQAGAPAKGHLPVQDREQSQNPAVGLIARYIWRGFLRSILLAISLVSAWLYTIVIYILVFYFQDELLVWAMYAAYLLSVMLAPLGLFAVVAASCLIRISGDAADQVDGQGAA